MLPQGIVRQLQRKTARQGVARRFDRDHKSRLKGDLSAKLQNAPRPSRDYLTEVPTGRRPIVRIVSHRSANRRGCKRIKSVLCVVEDVESLHAELEADSFSKPEVLADAQVPVIDTGATNDVPSAVTELSSQRLYKAGRVKPFRQALVEPAVWITPRNNVRSLCEGGQQS